MLKVNDEIIVVGGCQSCGCTGTVIEVTNEKVKVRFAECPTKSSNKDFWFRIANVRLLTEMEKKEKPRKLYKITDDYDEEIYCKLTKDQINLLYYLEEKELLNCYFDEADEVEVDEP